ncbi:DUF6634 family protein [Thalassorhabdomicrobium marinisediminis]|uniref:DUF6634 family protein n=1 Tax=Thalassorhabdomicrobium marinisediminis TaxID=2170577 RepID=UPI0011B28637|nr:DUF6634 family protein [Thalassorhabdomicrobium marinisediminis]
MDPNASDLELLNGLRQANPEVVSGARGKLFVVADTLPDDILASLESSGRPVKYVKVDAVWCVPIEVWLSCKRRLQSELMRRMTVRSLALGRVGPSSSDLEMAPSLSHWIGVKDPAFGGAILIGQQSGHPSLKGKFINTSRLCGIDPGGNWARTATRWYRLEAPADPEDVCRLYGAPGISGSNALELADIQVLVETDQASGVEKDE